jgi:hypothetical protein
MNRAGLILRFLICLFASACSRGDGGSQPAPGIGSIYGTRIVIPAQYKFFPVEYEGDDIWARPPTRHVPGPDVPIRSFSLLLHLPDFAPLNRENRASWLGLKGEDARSNEWINAGIQPLRNIDKAHPDRWFSDFFITRQMQGELGWRVQQGWYFHRQSDTIYGLVNEKKIGPDYSKISGENTEVFYDPDRATTYIVCGTGAGFTKFCDQHFTIPELSVLVDVFYAKQNLASWKTIQDNVRHLVLSFRK